MDTEISFGDFQESKPQTGVSPDRNPHFAVAWVGESSDSMPIFVDLDVMRELEAHALDNINVELGGVLLGEQFVDAEARPFVVVRDSLRAEHYQATRGSFKFTHETWEAITRQRDQFPDKFAIVGWYHTHPGWGVFLSDMDMFICDHFFNRPLDVALVIDPVRDDRGWFAWSRETQPPTKGQLSGFALFSHRHREEELQLVAEYYNERELMSADPRVRMPKTTPSATTVSLMERSPSPAVWITGGALILGQFLLIAVMLLRMPNSAQSASSSAAGFTDVELLVRERQAQAKSDVYRDALIAAVEKSPETDGIVERFSAVNEQNLSLRSNLEGQAALARELQGKLDQTTENLDKLNKEHAILSKELSRRDSRVAELETRLSNASAASNSTSGTIPLWIMIVAVLAAIAAAAGGGAAGFFLGRRQYDEEMTSENLELRGNSGEDSKIKLA